MYLRALSLAVGQFDDPHFRAVLWKGLAITAAVFAGLLGFEIWLFQAWFADELVRLAEIGSWLAWIAEALAIAAMVGILLVLFPMFATMAVSVFLDDVALAVERRHYPDEREGEALPPVEALTLSGRFLLLSLALNLASLPLHLMGLFFPVINVCLFYGLNGYLVSREYFSLVSLRHMGRNDAERLRRMHSGKVFAAGTVVVFLMTVPVVNLAAPIVGTAFMTHVFKALSGKLS